MPVIAHQQEIRIVECQFPRQMGNQMHVESCKSQVPVNNESRNVYQTVQFYEQFVFPNIQTRLKKIVNRIHICSLINIHNEEGIKDVSLIIRLASKIQNGEKILEPGGLPNIKLARLRSKDLLVFDGHHSLLAYQASGKVFIHEVPHIIVTHSRGYLENEEIMIFWGSHAPRIAAKNWRKFVVNWQKSGSEQLEERVQANMGELFDALEDRILP